MIDYQPLFQALIAAKAGHWVDLLAPQLTADFAHAGNRNSAKWLAVIAHLPQLKPSLVALDSGAITIGAASDITTAERDLLLLQLQSFHPWRKGPYTVFGIHIDAEWRSDWKWERLKPHITPLTKRLVLDVGCGNGYHCWRMLGSQARMVVGIDPVWLNLAQFQAIRALHGNAAAYVLPLRVEHIPSELHAFDTVFSMGVLYHQRSPLDHLLALKGCLRSGGELVLETLVIAGGSDQVMLPAKRYAKMRNVWFLPSCKTLISWLQRCGFKNCRVVDVNQTTSQEQRTTAWMQFDSLETFLDPHNADFTCEGMPAPRRAIVIANTV